MKVLERVKELLEIEERNDIFNLTTKERKEFQAELLERVEEYHPAVEELEIYEEAKEQGLLIILPCKKGDTIWESDEYMTEFVECEVLRFGFDDAGEIYCIYSAKDKTFHAKRYLKEFGKTLFVSKEQARQALNQIGE